MRFLAESLLLMEGNKKPVGVHFIELSDDYKKKFEKGYCDISVQDLNACQKRVEDGGKIASYLLGTSVFGVPIDKMLPSVTLIEDGKDLCTPLEIKAESNGVIRRERVGNMVMYFVRSKSKIVLSEIMNKKLDIGETICNNLLGRHIFCEGYGTYKIDFAKVENFDERREKLIIKVCIPINEDTWAISSTLKEIARNVINNEVESLVNVQVCIEPEEDNGVFRIEI